MAYISQARRLLARRSPPTRLQPVYRSFDTKQQAQAWARRVEAKMDADANIDRSASERTTLRDSIGTIPQSIVPQRRHPYQKIVASTDGYATIWLTEHS